MVSSLRNRGTRKPERRCNLSRILHFANGDIYEGGFYEGNYDGQGKYIFANGDVFEGEFVNGKRHGQGGIILANGDRCEGIWEDDKLVERI